MITLKEMQGNLTLAEFLYKCKNDFKFWCDVVLADLFQKEWGGIQEFHLEWFKLIEANNRVVILAPSGFAKSTVLAVAYPLWIAFTKTNKQIMIVSKTLPQSLRLLEVMRVVIDSNELLQELKPQNADKSWSKQILRTTSNCRIFVRPYSINIKGERVDYTILDEAASYDRPEIYLDYIVPRLNPNGRIVLISTPESPVDLMTRLNKGDYINKTYVAEYEINGKRVALWPERFPLEKLDKLKEELGENYYEKNFMCNPKAEEENAIFPFRIIESCLDDKRKLTFSTEGGSVYMGVDLAASSGPRADYDCFITVAKIGGFTVLLHGEVHKGWSIKSKVERINELANTFKENLVSIIVDQSNIGPAIIDDLRNMGLPVEGQDFHPTNRNMLLMNLKKELENKTLIIPFDQDDALTQIFTKKLILELVKFKEVTTDKTGQRLTVAKYISAGTHDDTVMALAMACQGASLEKPFVDYIAVA